MTLDVTIGKLAIERGDSRYNEEKSRVWLCCDMCSSAKEDICQAPFTAWPRLPFRSGSSSYFEWWKMNKAIEKLYYIMKPYYPDTNDTEIALLKPLLDEINELKESDFERGNKEDDERNLDRLKWLKYWANKAVELYGDDAVIMFS